MSELQRLICTQVALYKAIDFHQALKACNKPAEQVLDELAKLCFQRILIASEVFEGGIPKIKYSFTATGLVVWDYQLNGTKSKTLGNYKI